MRATRLVVVALAAAVLGCGEFDVNDPPRWARSIDRMLPAKRMTEAEFDESCFGPQFARCQSNARASRSLMRKATVRLLSGAEVTVTYTPNEKGNEVIVTAEAGKTVTVPVRKSGGRLQFDCAGMNCIVALE